MSEYNPTRPGSQQVSSDLFGFEPPADPNNLVGLRVEMPTPCPSCARNVATIGEGRGPHKASLHCTACERHRGWMSIEAFHFVSDLVRRFGRPTEPIVVRTSRDGGESEAVHQPQPKGN
jgi:hypothetical protein